MGQKLTRRSVIAKGTAATVLISGLSGCSLSGGESSLTITYVFSPD